MQCIPQYQWEHIQNGQTESGIGVVTHEWKRSTSMEGTFYQQDYQGRYEAWLSQVQRLSGPHQTCFHTSRLGWRGHEQVGTALTRKPGSRRNDYRLLPSMCGSRIGRTVSIGKPTFDQIVCKLFESTIEEKDSLWGSCPQDHFWMDWEGHPIQFKLPHGPGAHEHGQPRQEASEEELEWESMDTSIGALMEKEKTALMKIGACFRCKKTGHLSRDCPDKNQASGGHQVEAPKKFTPKDIHGNIRSLTKEEGVELMALMTAEEGDF